VFILVHYEVGCCDAVSFNFAGPCISNLGV
jgi:hypothetical protein